VAKKYTGFGRGYTGFSYHVTGGHEAEAEEAERAKPPNRFGLFMLRRLGFKGNPEPPPEPPPHHSPR
jgi:hypothetical protein